ncbi:MAG: biotin/lipoyl-containing protein [Peptostreptococcus porci]|uniref:Biotin carboxyl carrier protein of acetyl-CoA carboxylase n=1 Tax=Peptostreptococcus porci TaxID=2652282 RepID=A0A6N7XFZ9_9FIRM|nr:biotin/lipoyl-containing protein [Peptostreptococcus porci]MDY2794182.1 biotin/lipoyl-containing protein [Peptostreptococcus porci]MDY4561414.1 biotin/lipoyl-containing protein [Peptostreptococcus porci]MDY5480028.1 biotin/lipoyl-containing protein [Peptostreptococcus porci]MDY6231442.1 biotin/lipoyl-containing protein [Peptostreptococcus porci]MST62533.1 acetyl-CoA carboxylase, biotin carboxyl carrier protein [Peptostreptococcus porci]
MDTKFISELADIINSKGLRELEYSSKDERILLVKNYEQYDDKLDIDSKNFDNKNKSVKNNNLPVESNESSESDDEINCDCENIKANIIGTFYDKPSPDEDAFVHVGKVVKKGDVVCIIESMKLMNEIKAPFDCEILSINVENEEIVEFGQDLFDVKVIK